MSVPFHCFCSLILRVFPLEPVARAGILACAYYFLSPAPLLLFRALWSTVYRTIRSTAETNRERHHLRFRESHPHIRTIPESSDGIEGDFLVEATKMVIPLRDHVFFPLVV